MSCKCDSYSNKLIHACALITIVLALVAGSAYGQTKKQLENEKVKLEKEIKQLNKQLSDAKKTTRLNTKQLNDLNKKITERTKLIENINSQMQILDAQIGTTRDSISMMRAGIDSLKTEYGKVVVAMYKARYNVNNYSMLLDNKSYNRSYLKLRSFNEYSRYRQHQADLIRSKETQLLATAENLQRQRAEQNSLLQQENRNKALLAKEQQQKQQSLTASKQQEKQLTKQIGQKEKQRQQLQQQIQKIINEEIAKARKAEAARKAAEAKKKAEAGKSGSTTKTSTASTTKPATTTKPSGSSRTSTATNTAESAESAAFSKNKGGLPWPVSYKSVAREYGRYTHASGGVNMNNGIDLNCAPGASVTAVASGKVSRVFTCPNGSKGVIMRHGDYMTVYANMGSVSVKEGASVNARQALGTVWKGDGSGTAEFSFQLWNGTSSQNPRAWLR